MFSLKNYANVAKSGLVLSRSLTSSTKLPAVQLVSLNCYLVPKLFTFKKQNDTCQRQDERAEAIGSFVKHFDIVCLQEMWGANTFQIQKNLMDTHNLIPGYKSLDLFGQHSKLVDTIHSWIRRNGGTWFSHRKKFPRLGHWKQTFRVSQSLSMKGVQALLLDMKAIWPNKNLLIFNTHLDPTKPDNRKLQIKQIFDFMQTVVNICKQKYSMRDCGVLLLGDFNICSKWPEYLELMYHYPQLKDLYSSFLKKSGTPGVEETTYDANTSLATKIHPISRRIDYIFALDYLENDQFLPLGSSDFKIQKQSYGMELSDHWPQVVEIHPIE